MVQHFFSRPLGKARHAQQNLAVGQVDDAADVQQQVAAFPGCVGPVPVGANAEEDSAIRQVDRAIDRDFKYAFVDARQLGGRQDVGFGAGDRLYLGALGNNRPARETDTQGAAQEPSKPSLHRQSLPTDGENQRPRRSTRQHGAFGRDTLDGIGPRGNAKHRHDGGPVETAQFALSAGFPDAVVIEYDKAVGNLDD